MKRALEFRLVTASDVVVALDESKRDRPQLGVDARFRDVDDRLIAATLIRVDGETPRRGWFARQPASSKRVVREVFKRLNQPSAPL